MVTELECLNEDDFVLLAMDELRASGSLVTQYVVVTSEVTLLTTRGGINCGNGNCCGSRLTSQVGDLDKLLVSVFEFA